MAKESSQKKATKFKESLGITLKTCIKINQKI
jgi:hypothetical protein